MSVYWFSCCVKWAFFFSISFPYILRTFGGADLLMLFFLNECIVIIFHLKFCQKKIYAINDFICQMFIRCVVWFTLALWLYVVICRQNSNRTNETSVLKKISLYRRFMRNLLIFLSSCSLTLCDKNTLFENMSGNKHIKDENENTRNR